MRAIDVFIACKEGDMPVSGYLPFDGAEFCAHRRPHTPNDGASPVSADWVVTHVRTGLAVPYTASDTRKQAMEFADILSRQCPLAKDIVRGKRRGDVAGPVKAFANEVKTALGVSK